MVFDKGITNHFFTVKGETTMDVNHGRMFRRGTVVVVVVLLMLTGCATKIKMKMLQPAQYHEASTTKRIAVMPFSGRGGEGFASELEGVLGNIFIDDEQYFTLVDRSSIDKTMSELQLSMSGAVSEATAAKVGQMVGAEGIYTGVITQSACKDVRYKRNRRRCTEREIKYDKKGNAYEGKCIKWTTYSVNCTKRVATFDCSPKLIEVATGRIVYSRNLSGGAEDAKCTDQMPLRSKAELIHQAKEVVKGQLRKDVAPYFVTREVVLMNSKKGIDSKEAKRKLNQGIEYARKQRLDRAGELWEEARNLSPGAPAIIYNLGVYAESEGKYEEALSLFQQADRLLDKPTDAVNAALKRVQTAIKDRKKLKEQLGND